MRLLLIFSFALTSLFVHAQSDSSHTAPLDSTKVKQHNAQSLVGVSGDSRYHKYNIQVVGDRGDSMSVYDSARFRLPLTSEFYKLKVSRIKGETETEYQVFSFNITFNVGTDSIYIASMNSRYIEEPLLSKFKRGQRGDMFSIGDIMVKDERGRIVKAGSYLLFYE